MTTTDNQNKMNSLQYEIDRRFVREVERLEHMGFVKNRTSLERTVGVDRGGVAAIRLGLRGVGKPAILALGSEYGASTDYIMNGAPQPACIRAEETPCQAYEHRYAAPAQWRAGQQPEQFPGSYPEDPENNLWVAPQLPPTTQND